ncbi:MAG: hypothetical protein QGH20_05215 [Candidatus Latescibacteria bacterium]|nr:hypothetical protein [Candidatus Latescibacterota bacterium]
MDIVTMYGVFIVNKSWVENDRLSDLGRLNVADGVWAGKVWCD